MPRCAAVLVNPGSGLIVTCPEVFALGLQVRPVAHSSLLPHCGVQFLAIECMVLCLVDGVVCWGCAQFRACSKVGLSAAHRLLSNGQHAYATSTAEQIRFVAALGSFQSDILPCACQASRLSSLVTHIRGSRLFLCRLVSSQSLTGPAVVPNCTHRVCR